VFWKFNIIRIGIFKLESGVHIMPIYRLEKLVEEANENPNPRYYITLTVVCSRSFLGAPISCCHMDKGWLMQQALKLSNHVFTHGQGWLGVPTLTLTLGTPSFFFITRDECYIALRNYTKMKRSSYTILQTKVRPI